MSMIPLQMPFLRQPFLSDSYNASIHSVPYPLRLPIVVSQIVFLLYVNFFHSIQSRQQFPLMILSLTELTIVPDQSPFGTVVDHLSPMTLVQFQVELVRFPFFFYSAGQESTPSS